MNFAKYTTVFHYKKKNKKQKKKKNIFFFRFSFFKGVRRTTFNMQEYILRCNSALHST